MSDANARPSDFRGFVLREKYSRVECDREEYAGLWAEVRTNLTYGERADFVERLDELNQAVDAEVRHYQDRFAAIAKKLAAADAADVSTDEATAAKTKAFTAALRDQRKLLDEQANFTATNRRARLALIAPFVRAWNLCDGDGADVPPPAADIEGAIRWSDDVIMDWLIGACVGGYRMGKGLRTQSSASVPLPEPTNAPTPASAPEPTA